MIEAIKIIYDKSNIKEQYFWTELFQLTGIYTYTITQKQVRSFKNRNSYDYDAVLILIQNIKPEEVNNSRLKLRACGNKQPALEMDY